MQQNVLLLTTVPPENIKAEWPYYQNWTLPQALRERGASVSIKCWRDDGLTIGDLASYHVITFLWCNNYHLHPIEFPDFVRCKLLPAQKLQPSMRVANDPHIILWNTDKEYLDDLKSAGFAVPKTEFVRDLSAFRSTEVLAQHLTAVAQGITTGPVILKPSISGSSKQTYRIDDPSNLSHADHDFLGDVLHNGIDGALIAQEFEPAIANGEYSLVFIAGEHTHTMVKTPARGDFRCQAEFGGGIAELRMDEVPEAAKKTAEEVMRYMNSEVGAVSYCRVDGVLRDTGDFVLMEVEAIEPHLWLETCNDPAIRESLYAALLRSSAPSTALDQWVQRPLQALMDVLWRIASWLGGPSVREVTG
jgi:glutathione synthase/RimK-type ligase-like ATP-grasp enzyme